MPEPGILWSVLSIILCPSILDFTKLTQEFRILDLLSLSPYQVEFTMANGHQAFEEPNNVSDATSNDGGVEGGSNLSGQSIDLLKEGSVANRLPESGLSEQGDDQDLRFDTTNLYAETETNSEQPENRRLTPEERVARKEASQRELREQQNLDRLGARTGAGDLGRYKNDAEELGEIIQGDGDGKVSQQEAERAGRKAAEIFGRTQRGREFGRKLDRVLPGLSDVLDGDDKQFKNQPKRRN